LNSNLSQGEKNRLRLQTVLFSLAYEYIDDLQHISNKADKLHEQVKIVHFYAPLNQRASLK